MAASASPGNMIRISIFKRARASAAMLGTADYHRERIAVGLGL